MIGALPVKTTSVSENCGHTQKRNNNNNNNTATTTTTTTTTRGMCSYLVHGIEQQLHFVEEDGILVTSATYAHKKQ